uniref:Uncharacterized protein n=1 Tax=Panagrolaimus davidi TaxID=227884 RepID=A0A914PJ22_9BILA
MNNLLIVSVSAKKTNDTQSYLIKPNPPSTTPPATSSTKASTPPPTTTISSTEAPITSTTTEAAVEAITESQSNHSSQHSQTPTPNIYIKTLGGEETCFYDGMPWCSSSASYGTFYSTLDARIFALFIAQFIV